MLLVPKNGLILDRNQLRLIHTPRKTETWTPIPHYVFVDLVRSELERRGIKIRGEEHGVSEHGQRYFGIFYLTTHVVGGIPYETLCGIRNSHDKTFSAGITWGAHVMVCSNLSFTGEITIRRKHTNYILEDLPDKVGEAVTRLEGFKDIQERRFSLYRDCEISTGKYGYTADYLLMEAWRNDVITSSQIGLVHDEWIESSFKEFRRDKNLWTLFNAFTTVLTKRVPTPGLIDRTSKLQTEVLDTFLSQVS